MSRVSVVILTLDEEANIGACMDSCWWSDDIVVFDSLSKDLTRSIALQKGARVIERPFDNYAGQRNAALTTVSFRHEWILMLDADERVPADLVGEMQAALARASAETVLFRIRRKDFFMGRWLKRSGGYPTWFGRLMRRGRVRVEREVNEEFIPDGGVDSLETHLHHFPFNRGIACWFDRHNRYSTLEAHAKALLQSDPVSFKGAFSGDPVVRRRALKKLLYRLPLRPLIVFVYLYFVRLGVLDGRAGFYFSRMRAAYELSIDLKVLELERRQRGLPV